MKPNSAPTANESPITTPPANEKPVMSGTLEEMPIKTDAPEQGPFTMNRARETGFRPAIASLGIGQRMRRALSCLTLSCRFVGLRVLWKQPSGAISGTR